MRVDTTNDLQKFINEEVKKKLVQVDMVIKTDVSIPTKVLLTYIRAIEGVTIVHIVEATQRISDSQELTRIRIKYVPYGKIKISLKRLLLKIQTISGIFSTRVLKVNMVDI